MDDTTQSAIDVFGFLRRRKFSIIIPILFISSIAVLLSFRVPDVYESTATILIEGRQLDSSLNKGAQSIVEMRIENITQQIMKSNTIESYIKKFNLYEKMFENVQGTQLVSRKKSAIQKMRKNINIELITTDVINPRSGMPGIATIGFSVTFAGEDPDQVYGVTRELSDFFLAQNKKNRSEDALKTNTIINAELEAQKKIYEDIEERLIAFKERHSAYLPDKAPMNRQMVKSIESQLSKNEAEISKIKDQITIIEINENEDAKNLNRLQAELDKAQATLSFKHPDVIKLRKAVDKLEYEIKTGERKSTVLDPAQQIKIDALNTKLDKLRKTRRGLSAKQHKYVKLLEKTSLIENDYLVLVQDYNNSREVYNKLTEKGAQVKAIAAESVESAHLFSLIEPANYPLAPKPLKLYVIVIGVLIAGGFGFIYGITRELFDQTIWSDITLNRVTGRQVMAVIPKLKLKRSKAKNKGTAISSKEITYSDTQVVNVNEKIFKRNKLHAYFYDAPASEQFNILKTRLLEKIKDTGLNTILVTSAVEGEGKSLIASNLAISLSKELSSTVLLVDADLKKPSIHNFFKIKPDTGISDYFLMNTPLNSLFVNPGINKLVLLLGNRSIENSAEVIGASRMEKLIREMKEKYPDRYVIIDSSSVNEHADPIILSKYVDGVIMVVQAEKTKKIEITKAVGVLKDRNLLGLILNWG